MQVLLDADIIQYEVSFAAEAYWKYLHKEREQEVTSVVPWEIVEDMLNGRIDEINEDAGGEGKPLLFFTGKNNYRHHLAKTQAYKDREGQRPFHYKNVKAYLQSRYEWNQVEWFEADDLLKLKNNEGSDFIIVSRDKDLHQIPGMHYGWEVGKQPSFGPMRVTDKGFLKMGTGKTKKLVGGGEKFFYAQMLLGDPVDNIPGVNGFGPVSTLVLLSNLEEVEEYRDTVFRVYEKAYGEKAMDRFLETGNLLRMAEEVNTDWSKVRLWNPFASKPTWMEVKTGVLSENP